MREIVLDTETTGLDPLAGHRIVEIGCLELMNHVPTSRFFHRYINPEMEALEAEAVAVHGLTAGFLAKHPSFIAIADEFMEFIGDAPLVIHNAEFDMRFLNAEIARLGHPPFPPERALCTLKLTRKRYPGAPASLDALCQRFRIDNSGRTLHGALLDAQLLAEVYMELLGGRQTALGLSLDAPSGAPGALAGSGEFVAGAGAARVRPPRPHAASAEELAAHQAMLAKLTNALWLEAV